jgi:hypothetical protein
LTHSFRIPVLIYLIIGIIGFNSCIKTPPVVTTAGVNEITKTSAISGDEVTNNGGADVTARGVCWSTSKAPTISSSKTDDGKGIGSYIIKLTDLEEKTAYYVRAYSTNSEGTAYGNEIGFQTLTIPTLTTTAVTSITSNGAVSGGNISDDGGSLVTERGVCWSLLKNPIITDPHSSDGSGTGSYSSKLTGLRPFT